MKVHLKIQRFNPEKDSKLWWSEHDVEVDETDRVLDALHQVKWYHDGTLTLRRSCAHGICGSDAMRINGRNALACKVLIKDVGKEITVQPLLGMPLIKDLVVDMEPFFAKYRSVLPYLVNDNDPGDRERLQSPEERARYDDTTKCILCAAEAVDLDLDQFTLQRRRHLIEKVGPVLFRDFSVLHGSLPRKYCRITFGI